MSHISKEILKQNTGFVEIDPMDSRRMLVLSLGTGEAKHESKYNAGIASKWGMIDWLYDGGKTPMLDVFWDASSDIVDFHTSTLFQSLHSNENYLRIQVPRKAIEITCNAFLLFCFFRILNFRV